MLPGARPPALATVQLLLVRVEKDAEHELEQHARDEVGEDAVGARVAHPLEQVRRAVPLVEPYREHQLLLQNTRIVRKSIQIRIFYNSKKIFTVHAYYLYELQSAQFLLRSTYR